MKEGKPSMLQIKPHNLKKNVFEQNYLYVCILTKDISSRMVISYSFGVAPPKIGPLQTPLILYNQTVDKMEEHVHEMIE